MGSTDIESLVIHGSAGRERLIGGPGRHRSKANGDLYDVPVNRIIANRQLKVAIG